MTQPSTTFPRILETSFHESPMTAKTILLIEDHRDTRDVYGTMLRHSGYRVLEAKDGGEGVRLAREQKPDLVVMDLRLPFMDGWQATELLKEHEATAQIPVLVVTTHMYKFDRDHAQELGCDGFLTKPCPPAVLVNEIERLLA